ncbi:MAG: hypothetical protein J3K34DRAFT_429032 [Monoraphidium minutum]|nr:MAG: hypothetical protein J3K34DRAFT_429032 [Monoraphidium minutum]
MRRGQRRPRGLPRGLASPPAPSWQALPPLLTLPPRPRAAPWPPQRRRAAPSPPAPPGVRAWRPRPAPRPLLRRSTTASSRPPPRPRPSHAHALRPPAARRPGGCTRQLAWLRRRRAPPRAWRRRARRSAGARWPGPIAPCWWNSSLPWRLAARQQGTS